MARLTRAASDDVASRVAKRRSASRHTRRARSINRFGIVTAPQHSLQPPENLYRIRPRSLCVITLQRRGDSHVRELPAADPTMGGLEAEGVDLRGELDEERLSRLWRRTVSDDDERARVDAPVE